MNEPIPHPTLQNSVLQAVRSSPLRDSRFLDHPRYPDGYRVLRIAYYVMRNTHGMLFSSHASNTLPMFGEGRRTPAVNSTTLAFLQYTSGSTASHCIKSPYRFRFASNCPFECRIIRQAGWGHRRHGDRPDDPCIVIERSTSKCGTTRRGVDHGRSLAAVG